jgi:hypothetical protein|tara:strand:+ start:811 stop:1056 length:246 start_codon:yes stop_codon:yes gene_type:complete
MAIAKEKIISKIEIVGEYKIIQVAYDTVIKEDSTEISRSRTRNSFTPDKDVSGEDSEIVDIANLVWTDSVKAAYQTHLDNQ